MTELKRIYLEYLQTSHWYELRQDAFERDGFKCTICGSRDNLQGHHVRYRNNLFLCTLNDIVTLCKKCHESHHELKKHFRKQNRKPRQPKGGNHELTVDRTGHLTIKKPKRKHQKPDPPQKKRSPYRFFNAGGPFVTLDNRLIYQPRL